MKKMVLAVAAAVGVALAISACGGYDPTEAVNSLNKEVNQNLQTGLSAAGVPEADASQAGITIKCPDNVQKNETFTCTATGKLTGESTDVKMKVNDNDELTTADGAELGTALEKVITAESSQSAGQ